MTDECCSLQDGRAGIVDSVPGTPTTRPQLRHSVGRELAGGVQERLSAGARLPLGAVHRFAPAMLHLVL